jgi:hypothetical protein
MLRSTWAYRFTQEEVPEAFRLLGALFLDAAPEADRWDESPRAVGLVPESVEAAAEDLESLALYLDEIAEAPAEYTIQKADLMQCHRAAAWAGGSSAACGRDPGYRGAEGGLGKRPAGDSEGRSSGAALFHLSPSGLATS